MREEEEQSPGAHSNTHGRTHILSTYTATQKSAGKVKEKQEQAHDVQTARIEQEEEEQHRSNRTDKNASRHTYTHTHTQRTHACTHACTHEQLRGKREKEESRFLK